jgi:hypothetical protein
LRKRRQGLFMCTKSPFWFSLSLHLWV